MTINTDYHFVPPYAVMILLSFIAGNFGMYALNIRSGIKKNVSGYLILLSPMMSLFCGVYLTYITSGFRYYGLSSIGGLIGMYMAVLTMSAINSKINSNKKDTKTMLQNCTIILPLMYSISKIGCFFAGCCYGIEYSGVFCIHYTGHGNIPVHDVFPVQIAETIVFLGIFFVGIHFIKRKVKNMVWIVFVISAFAKGLLDFLRESHTGELISMNQILCIILMVFGMAVMFCSKIRR